jgi:hypothetical protein
MRPNSYEELLHTSMVVAVDALLLHKEEDLILMASLLH